MFPPPRLVNCPRLLFAAMLAVGLCDGLSFAIDAEPSRDEIKAMRQLQKDASALAGRVKRSPGALSRVDIEALEDRLGAFRRFAVHNGFYETTAAEVGDLRELLDIDFAETIPEIDADGPPYVVRVAYLIPSNRDASPAVVSRAATMLTWFQKWYADEMDRHGFGPMTFRFETRVDGAWPVVHPVKLPRPDSYYRGTPTNKAKLNQRVNQDAADAGIPIDAPGQVWWLLVEMQELQSDGSLPGTHRQGGLRSRENFNGAAVCDTGAINVMSLEALSDTRRYDGLVVPPIGKYPLRYNVSFDASRGRTVGEIMSALAGSHLHEISHAFGLLHDFRNDDLKAGNVMGLGLRGFRGWAQPERFRAAHSRLTANDAQILSLSRYFREPQMYTDSEIPRFVGSKMGETPEDGRIVFRFKASDDTELAYACLFVGPGCVGETTLTGKEAEARIAFDRFKLESQDWQLRLFDAAGNQRRVAGKATFQADGNLAPQPFVACPRTDLRVGERMSVEATKSKDPDGSSQLTYEWDLDGDGTFDAESSGPTYGVQYDEPGSYRLRCRVTDSDGGVGESLPIAIRVTAKR